MNFSIKGGGRKRPYSTIYSQGRQGRKITLFPFYSPLIHSDLKWSPFSEVYLKEKDYRNWIPGKMLEKISATWSKSNCLFKMCTHAQSTQVKKERKRIKDGNTPQGHGGKQRIHLSVFSSAHWSFIHPQGFLEEVGSEWNKKLAKISLCQFQCAECSGHA